MRRSMIPLCLAVAGLSSTPALASDEPELETAFVQASTLRLRSQPSARSKAKGQLRINYRLQVLRVEGDFAQVKAKNGATGWVGKDFIAPEPLNVGRAKTQASIAKTPADQLAWLQRAAALTPHDVELLSQLRDAYRSLKDERAAAMVARLIGVLERRWFPIRQDDADGVWVEWKEVDWPGAEVAIPKESWAKYDIPEGLTLWVLPQYGAAVQARVVEVRPDTWNECGGAQGINLKLDAKLPPGERALVATLGDPPASWKQAVQAPSRAPIDATFARYVGKLRSKPDKVTKALAVYEGGGFGVAAVLLGPGKDSDLEEHYEFHRLELDASGRITKKSKQREDAMFLWMPVARRDITGDGELESVYWDGCATYVQSRDDFSLFSSYMRCCGC